jgi:hypothetical protein
LLNSSLARFERFERISLDIPGGLKMGFASPSKIFSSQHGSLFFLVYRLFFFDLEYLKMHASSPDGSAPDASIAPQDSSGQKGEGYDGNGKGRLSFGRFHHR